jgi:N6-L-threonylcarbamoyladenine synthase
MGSLLVGASFAKGFALASDVNLIDINHLQAHILVHFIREKGIDYKPPSFPFLCLLASGGHTQLVVVKDHLHHEIIGRTIDDAAGEAFDKCAKVMGLPYPGGPLIDKLAKEGNPDAYHFSKPRIPGYDYSYSGLKTSFLYFLRDQLKENENFVSLNKVDLCASLQKAIVDVLMEKLLIASKETGIREIALAGGVSANAGLRTRVQEESARQNWKTYIPPVKFTTDNAAMIAINGYYKFLKGEFAGMSVSPSARVDF